MDSSKPSPPTLIIVKTVFEKLTWIPVRISLQQGRWQDGSSHHFLSQGKEVTHGASSPAGAGHSLHSRIGNLWPLCCFSLRSFLQYNLRFHVHPYPGRRKLVTESRIAQIFWHKHNLFLPKCGAASPSWLVTRLLQGACFRGWEWGQWLLMLKGYGICTSPETGGWLHRLEPNIS